MPHKDMFVKEIPQPKPYFQVMVNCTKPTAVWKNAAQQIALVINHYDFHLRRTAPSVSFICKRLIGKIKKICYKPNYQQVISKRKQTDVSLAPQQTSSYAKILSGQR
ncbi:hypothetical protein XENOCAPTIV_011095 [Xenoophorus captivus]|uniref:Uncharacterized protein n=1 Tax=Xenoophorus captivus TaxID=1517983 RepID=A0ABV0QHQ5_9TELE